MIADELYERQEALGEARADEPTPAEDEFWINAADLAEADYWNVREVEF